MAARARREVGIRSFGIAVDGVRARASGSPRAVRRRARAPPAGPASRWRWAPASASGTGVAAGRRRRRGARAGRARGLRRRRLLLLLLPVVRRRRPVAVAVAEERRRVARAPDLLAGDQLGGGDERDREHEGERARGEADLPLARRQAEAAGGLDGALRRGLRQRLEVLGRRRRERVEVPVVDLRAPGRRAREAATVFTVSVGRFRPSVTRATMIGVIAAANTVPGFQRSGMTKAAAALAAPAISSVWRERPDWRGSADTPLHASEMPLAPRGARSGAAPPR